MATQTKSGSTTSKTRSSTRDQEGPGLRERAGSIFNFGEGSTGAIVTAAAAGVAFGLAANLGRKMLVQSVSAASGDWVDALTAEHRATLAVFDKIEATDDSQASQRAALLGKLKYALSKHALQEENVIYPALREANIAHEADTLNSEHGYVKTYLYELETMSKDSPDWLARVRDFRAMIQEHMRMEEEQVFPRFREQLSETQNTKLTAMMHKEGLKLA